MKRIYHAAFCVTILLQLSTLNVALGEAPAGRSLRDEELGREILSLFAEDQKSLRDFEAAKEDQTFARAYEERKARVLQTHPPVFYDLAIKELWAAEPDSPEIVRKSVEWRNLATERVKAIIAEKGWPQRASVGDEAAGAFFFLFGHADTSNKWRRTQLKTIRAVFEADHLNPRLYAHLCDRLESVDGKPQIYGTVMGPGSDPGSAKLYCLVIDSLEAVDLRRAEIGLPTLEDDLERFRNGAKIGPYMTPITKEWTMSEVYGTP